VRSGLYCNCETLSTLLYRMWATCIEELLKPLAWQTHNHWEVMFFSFWVWGVPHFSVKSKGKRSQQDSLMSQVSLSSHWWVDLITPLTAFLSSFHASMTDLCCRYGSDLSSCRSTNSMQELTNQALFSFYFLLLRMSNSLFDTAVNRSKCSLFLTMM